MTAAFEIGFDALSGAIVRLSDRTSGRRWATPAFPLGLIRYRSYDEVDYARFHRQYVNKDEAIAWWAVPDFTKPGIDAAGAQSQVWMPQLDALYHRRDQKRHYLPIISLTDRAPSPPAL